MAKNASKSKLAVISQAHQSSNHSNNDNNNNDTITVVVCPKNTTAIRLSENDKQNQYPYYERLCNKYGFSLDVEIIYQPSISSSSSSKRVSGGPKTSHYVLSNHANSTAYTPSKLQYHSERLIIQPPPRSKSNSGSKSSNSEQLRPDFQPGDILTSIDGMPYPTFDMVYAVMMRSDKLILEIHRNKVSNRKSGGRKVNSKSSMVQGGNNVKANQLGLEHPMQTTSSTTAIEKATSTSAATTTKKKRQVPAWDAENRRVQKEQTKLQREQDKSQQQKRQRAGSEHSSRSTAAVATTSTATTLTATATATTSKASTSRKINKQQQQPSSKSTNNNQSHKSSTKINVHSPTYIQKAVARLGENLQEYNRLQKEDEMAMYGEHNRMLLDHTLMDEFDGVGRESGEGMMKEVNRDDGGERALSVATAPTATLTIDNDDDDDSSPSLVFSVTSSNDNPLILEDHTVECTMAGDGKESSYPQSESSSSVPSSSESSSVPSSSSSSSSSSSDSDSSNDANYSNEKKKPIHPPRTIATTTATSMNTPPRKSSHTRFNSSSENIANPTKAKVITNQLPIKRSRSSSTASQDIVGGKTYPTYSSISNTLNNRNRSNTTKKSGSTDASTSLGRLWPDPSDIVKALTSWQPPSATVKQRGRVEFYGSVSHCNLVSMGGKRGGGLGASSSNPLLQDGASTNSSNQYNEFRNADEMMDGLARPLMDEGLASINNEYNSNKFRSGAWNRDTYRLVVIKITPVTPIFTKDSSFYGEHVKLYEIQFSLKGETRIPPSNLSELYCLHYHRWRSCKMGIVGHDFPTTITFRTFSESNSILKLFVCVDETLNSGGGGSTEEGKTGWLSKDEFRALFDPHKFGVPHPNAVLTLMSVGSTTNIVRQFEAIASIGHLKPHIQKTLFTSQIQTAQKSTSSTLRPKSLPTDIWKKLQRTHNPYQLKSISKVVSGSCKNNVCLIQGPPGTGKSSTIVGIVSALLSGKAPLPGQKQSGCLIHPGKTMGVSHTQPQARNRILVCAATNTAVDTIAWKIKNGTIGPSGKIGDFKMSRFGSLPWDQVNDNGRKDSSVKVNRPLILTEMEQFLYDINVDRRASDGIQTNFHDYQNEEEDNYKCWSPDGKKKPQKKRRKRIVGRGAKRKEIISESSVVVTTLSGAGSKAFIDAACRDPTRNDSEFDAVIIDEACVASESETLIPLKFNPTTITLVGDPRQLPVLSLAASPSKKSLYERSLFERMQNLQWPTMLLREQYRMHERIAAFPSRQFYEAKLITAESVNDRLPTPWADDQRFPTLCFWDTKRSAQSGGGGGQDFTNIDESDFILRRIMTPFMHKFSEVSLADDPNTPISIGIISFYKDQVNALQQQWDRFPALNASKFNIKIATVDGFQGSECDVIILSCVRSRHMHGKKTSSIGFLSDERRMNVALTRAKRCLWVVGDSDVLKANPIWKRLIDHLGREGVLRNGGQNQSEVQTLSDRWIAPRR